MRIQFSIVGQPRSHPDIWVNLEQVPREDEIIHIPGLSEADTYVRTVVWHPLGDEEDDECNLIITEPFVYVVVGPRRKNYV